MPRYNVPEAERIAKLPSWARNYIADLERERDRALRARKELQDTEDRLSGVSYGSGSSGSSEIGERRYLPADRHASFRYEIEGDEDRWIELIPSYNNGSYDLQVRANDSVLFSPIASNVLGIRLNDGRRR